MSRVCQICGKGPLFGHTVARRGKPKKKGGGGSHVVRRSKRRQLPNLQMVRAEVNGRPCKLRVCAKCLKAGKPFRRRP
jgi:large subunit ribosomal protein L28